MVDGSLGELCKHRVRLGKACVGTAGAIVVCVLCVVGRLRLSHTFLCEGEPDVASSSMVRKT